MKLEYNQKIKNVAKLRQDFKKKRFILDESLENFGLDTFKQLTNVKNIDEIKGYPFKGYFNDLKKTNLIKLAFKLIPIESKYTKQEHPSNIEYLMLKEFNDELVLKNVTPHVVNYIGYKKIYNKSKAIKFLNLKRLEHENKILNYSNVLISEYIEAGSLDNWVYEIYQNQKEITCLDWKCLVFGLLYTIYVLQDKYKFMHNDLHYGNILIDEIQKGGYIVYTIENVGTWYLPNNGFIAKLWDMEFGMVYSTKNTNHIYVNRFIVGNSKINYKTREIEEDDHDSDALVNIPITFNKVYDVHYLLTSLLDLYISDDLFDWIMKLYPDELIPPSEHTSHTCTSNSSASKLTESTTNKSNTNSTSLLSYSSKSSSSNSSYSESSELSELLHDGRLVNGVEDLYKDLPIALDLLTCSFFDEFKIKPKDFNKDTSLFFEYKLNN